MLAAYIISDAHTTTVHTFVTINASRGNAEFRCRSVDACGNFSSIGCHDFGKGSIRYVDHTRGLIGKGFVGSVKGVKGAAVSNRW